VIFIADAFAL
jgi:serine/threonine protein kinase